MKTPLWLCVAAFFLTGCTSLDGRSIFDNEAPPAPDSFKENPRITFRKLAVNQHKSLVFDAIPQKPMLAQADIAAENPSPSPMRLAYGRSVNENFHAARQRLSMPAAPMPTQVVASSLPHGTTVTPMTFSVPPPQPLLDYVKAHASKKIPPIPEKLVTYKKIHAPPTAKEEPEPSRN
jgi:hypothetical protein